MKHAYAVLVVTAAVTTACAVRPAKIEPPPSVPVVKPAPPAKAVPPRKEPAAEAGKPAPDSKFARLKTGMSLSEVEQLIGAPSRQWQHATEKARIPYYFGPDRWVIEYSYKGEGVLTFNSGGEQLLTHIEVNTAE